MRRLILITPFAIAVAASALAEPQPIVLPQEPAPATNAANEQVILEQLTARRDWQAKAISLQAYAEALVKQNNELRSKIAELDKKAADAAAEVGELRHQAAAADRAKRQQSPMPPAAEPQKE